MTAPSGWSPDPAPPPREGLRDLIRRLLADGRAYAEAEARRQKVRATYIAACVRDIAIAGVIALVLFAGMLVTLMIGLVWALAPVLGNWGALGVVVGGTLIVILLLGLFARSRVKRITRRLK